MPRTHAERDIVAATPYRPPVAASTRTGRRKVVLRLASGGLLAGATVLAAIALTGTRTAPHVEVTFRAPRPVTAQAPVTTLVIHRGAHRVTLVRDGEPVWHAHGPISCVTGRPLQVTGSRAALVARACIELRDGAVVGLDDRVPAGTTVDVR